MDCKQVNMRPPTLILRAMLLLLLLSKTGKMDGSLLSAREVFLQLFGWSSVAYPKIHAKGILIVAFYLG